MRPITMVTLPVSALAFSALLALAPPARAQSYTPPNQNGLGNAAGILNNLVNPQQNNQQQNNRNPNDNRYPTDARAGGPYARFTDDQLRTEFRRVQNEQRDIDDEMRRRNLR